MLLLTADKLRISSLIRSSLACPTHGETAFPVPP